MKHIFGIIFSKKIIVILLLVLQLFVLTACFYWLTDYTSYIYWAFTIISTTIIIYEINREEYVDFKIPWLILIAAIPIFGSLLYIFLHTNFVTFNNKQKLKEAINETSKYLKQNDDVINEISSEEDTLLGLSNFVNFKGHFPTYNNSDITYFPTGMKKLEQLLYELKQAKKFIFLEYFIIQQGYMWNSILEILKEKVKEGVEVRLLYDGMGCMLTLPSDFNESLILMGIKCKTFSAITPLFTTYQNNRDHRKILVIDGNTAFTGGINLADEYVGKKKRYGVWKDTAIMVKGEAVKSFTLMFLQLWNTTETLKEDYAAYIPKVKLTPNAGNRGYIIPYADAPIDNEYMGMRVYLEILNTAKKYVYFMSPYLILPSELKEAFEYAAKRGIDVRIIMPHIPDKKYTFLLSRTYYPELIQAGVKLYEYSPGFTHGKMCVSDGIKAVVGTINLDYRSLFLHYECAVYIHKNPVISEIKNDFDETMKDCIEFTQQDYKNLSKIERLKGRLLRLFAPLM